MGLSELEMVVDGLWVARQPLRVGGIVALGTRMTVARLDRGGLFLHSPVAYTPSLAQAVSSLGEVKVITAPNKRHHLFVGDWMHAFPAATSIAAPGLVERRRDLRFQATWSEAPARDLGESLEHLCLQGMPMLNEVVFLHRPTRTLIATDLLLNFNRKESDTLGQKLYYWTTGAGNGPAQNAVLRMLVADRKKLRQSLDRLLLWDFDRIVVCHGEIVSGNGKAVLKEATAWLGMVDEFSRQRCER